MRWFRICIFCGERILTETYQQGNAVWERRLTSCQCHPDIEQKIEEEEKHLVL